MLAAAAGLSPSAQQQNAAAPATTTPPFESYVELLRQQAGIPGNLGHNPQGRPGRLGARLRLRQRRSADRGHARHAGTIGDLSETFATVLLLQCVEQRHLDLDDPLTRYKVDLGDPTPTLRQVLSHWSTTPNSPPFKSPDPACFSQLSGAVEFCAPQPYRKSVSHRLLERLAMRGLGAWTRDMKDPDVVPEGLFNPAVLKQYRKCSAASRSPTSSTKKASRPVRDAALPESLTASDGIVSTVRDLARLDAAIDDGILLLPETLTVAWTNASGRDGTALPTGLGWFVQSYHGEPVVWQFGLIPGRTRRSCSSFRSARRRSSCSPTAMH